MFGSQILPFTEHVDIIVQMRKQLRDMEAKVKDQEEELDEQAGTIQMLEQVHIKTQCCYHWTIFKAVLKQYGGFIRNVYQKVEQLQKRCEQ